MAGILLISAKQKLFQQYFLLLSSSMKLFPGQLREKLEKSYCTLGEINKMDITDNELCEFKKLMTSSSVGKFDSVT